MAETYKRCGTCYWVKRHVDRKNVGYCHVNPPIHAIGGKHSPELKLDDRGCRFHTQRGGE